MGNVSWNRELVLGLMALMRRSGWDIRPLDPANMPQRHEITIVNEKGEKTQIPLSRNGSAKGTAT